MTPIAPAGRSKSSAAGRFVGEVTTAILALLAAPAEVVCWMMVAKGGVRGGGHVYYALLGLVLPMLAVVTSLRARRGGSILKASWSPRQRWTFGVAALLVLAAAFLAWHSFAPITESYARGIGEAVMRGSSRAA